MKALVVCLVVFVAVPGLVRGQGQGAGAASPGVAVATEGPDGFVVTKGVIYAVRQGRANVLPDSLRWTGTVQGVKGFPKAIQELLPGSMLTTEGKVVPAPPLLFSKNAVGTIAPANGTDNSVDNGTTRATDNSVDNSIQRSADNSVDNRTTRATNNATDNRTTRSTNNAVDNSVSNRPP